MQAYRKTLPTVHVAKQHLALVADFVTRDEDTSAAAVGRDHGVSRAQIYKLVGRATAALVPRLPGPVPGVAAAGQAPARVKALETELLVAHARIETLELRLAGCIEVTSRRAHALELTLARENVSLRGTQRVFDVAFDGLRRASVGELHGRLRGHGRTARQLLDRARGQVRDQLGCLMGDDIFFAGIPIKVLAEPRSVAILNVGRWPWHAAEDWALWLEEFGALRLFISDLGSDLVGAAATHRVPHVADFFHEMQWWEGVMFAPLARVETEARKDALRALDIATTPFSARSRHDASRVAEAEALAMQAESDFFAAYAAIERVRALFQPRRPDGTLWTDATVQAELAAIDTILATIVHTVGARARKHVGTHGHRFAAHRHLLDAIVVNLRPDSAWTPHTIRQAMFVAWDFEAITADATRPMVERLEAQRQAQALNKRLQRHVRNLDAVAQALRRHLAYIPRSSSAIESLNSQLRVLQMVHRTVSDEMLALHALAWNLTPRVEGRRKGRSPYAMLGVDLGQGDRPWYEVLLDAQAA